MAKREVGLGIRIDGEKEYKKAISELNKGNQVLASEMKKLSAVYEGNEKNIEALNKKSDLLQRQLMQQKDKVQTLRDALANAAKEYGEADKRTQEWQIQLNNAEAAQAKLEHQLDETTKEIDEQSKGIEEEDKKMVSLGDAVDKVAGKLGIKLPEGAKKALDGMGTMSAGSVLAIGAIATAVAGAIEMVKKLTDMTIEAADKADELITRSMKTGIDTTTLQQLDYAKRFLDFGDVDAQLVKLTSSMGKARGGAEKQAEAFHTLGVAIYDADGTLRDNWETFKDVISALGEVTDETERDLLAQELLGKSYADLKPLIAAGTDELQKYMDQAIENGAVMDEHQIQKLGEVDDAYQEVQATIDGLKNDIAAEFAPAVIDGMNVFKDAVQKAGKALVDTGLIENIAAIVQGIVAIIDAGSKMIDALPSWANPINSLSTQLRGLAMVLAGVADAMTIVAGLLPTNWGSGMVKQGLGLGYASGNASNIQRMKMQYAGTLDQYDSYYGRNAGGNDNWRGGLTWVGEAGPELVALPRGSQIYSNQDSRAMGGQVININVNGIQQLDEIVGWYESRRVRGRMM